MRTYFLKPTDASEDLLIKQSITETQPCNVHTTPTGYLQFTLMKHISNLPEISSIQVHTPVFLLMMLQIQYKKSSTSLVFKYKTKPLAIKRWIILIQGDADFPLLLWDVATALITWSHTGTRTTIMFRNPTYGLGPHQPLFDVKGWPLPQRAQHHSKILALQNRCWTTTNTNLKNPWQRLPGMPFPSAVDGWVGVCVFPN